MICKNCHAENQDSTKFCIKCGSDLREMQTDEELTRFTQPTGTYLSVEQENLQDQLEKQRRLENQRRFASQPQGKSASPIEEEPYQRSRRFQGKEEFSRSAFSSPAEPKPKRKKWPVIVAILMILLLGGSGVGLKFYLDHIKLQKMIKQAEILTKEEAYDEAIALYEKISSEQGSSGYLLQIKTIKDQKESKELFEKGIAAYDQGDFVEAIKTWKKISEKDTHRYKKSQEKIAEAQDALLAEAKSQLMVKKYEEAQNTVDTCLKINPNDEKAGKLQEEIIRTQEREKKEEDLQKEEERRKEDERQKSLAAISVAASNSSSASMASQAPVQTNIQMPPVMPGDEEYKKQEAALKKQAQNLIGTYQDITAKDANIRSTPTVNDHNKIGTLTKGETVYILDAKVEDAQRIWVKVSLFCSPDVLGWMSYNTMNNKY